MGMAGGLTRLTILPLLVATDVGELHVLFVTSQGVAFLGQHILINSI